MNTTQIFKNAASNYGRMAVGMVTTLLMTPLLLHRLGAEAYGLWALTVTVGGYFGLIDLGITGAAVRYIAHYRALEDWPNLNKTIGTTQCCYIAMSGISLLGAVVLAILADRVFHVSAHNVPTMRLLALNIGLVGVVGFFSILPIQCVIAAQRQDVLNNWMLLSQVIITALTALGVTLGAGILLLAALQLVGGISNLVIGWALAQKFLPQARFAPRWDAEQGRLLFLFTGAALLISMAQRVIYYTDTIVIATFVSVAAVAGYSIILKIVEFMRGLVGAGIGVLGTFVSEQSARNNTEALGGMWREGTKWSLMVALPLGCALALLGRQILTAWVGPRYAYPALALALAWMAVGQIVDLAQAVGYQILMNTGRHRMLALITALEAIANLTLSILLIRPLGLVGVAVGTAIPLLVRNVVFYPLYLPRVTGLGTAAYLRAAVWPPIVAALPTMALTFAYRYGHFPAGRTSLALFAVLGTALTALSASQVCLLRSQRTQIRGAVSRALRRRPTEAGAASQ